MLGKMCSILRHALKLRKPWQVLEQEGVQLDADTLLSRAIQCMPAEFA